MNALVVPQSPLHWRWRIIFFVVGAAILVLGCQASKIRTSSEGPLSARYSGNMKLYAAVVDYIQTDTATRIFLKQAGPVKVWVLRETTCLPGINYWDLDGWLEWMGLAREDIEKQRHIEDSLNRRANLTPCDVDRIYALQELSTTYDRRYVVNFMNIDSTFLPGNFIVSAYLWDNVDGEDEGIGYMQAGKIYSVIFDSEGNIRKVFYGLIIGG